jgi:hypothetical protein
MKVICVGIVGPDGSSVKQDAWLTVGKEYVVLSVNGRGSTIKYRLLGDDRTTPALHNAEQFEITSPKIPEDWVFRIYPRASEWVITPSSWAGEGFWTAYFDADAAAKSLLEKTALAIESAS